jgi:hypothetical protein
VSAVVGALNVRMSLDSANFQAQTVRAQGTLRALQGQAQATGGAFRQLGGGSIQNAAFQIGDFATQVANGTRVSTALGQQLPQLLGSFGALGAVIGAGVAISVPLLAAAFGALTAEVATFEEELADTAAATSSIDGIVRDLKAAQDAYTAAIAATAGTQNAATSSIVADTRREFEAKKALLELELRRQQASLSVNRARADALEAQVRADLSGIVQPQSQEEFLRNPGRTSPDPVGGGVPAGLIRRPDIEARAAEIGDAASSSSAVFELRKLRAETTLTELAIEKLDEAARSTFEDIGGGSGAPAVTSGDAPASGGGGGRRTGGGSAGRAAAAITGVGQAATVSADNLADLAAEAQRVDQANRLLADSFTSLFGGAITGAESFKDSLADLASRLADLAISNAFKSIVSASGIGATGVGGIFNAIFGVPAFAAGTAFAPGGLALVGERGPELVNLPRGSQVVPNHALGGMGGTVVHFAPVINAAGADAAGLAQVRAEVRAMHEAFPDMLARALGDPRRRGRI